MLADVRVVEGHAMNSMKTTLLLGAMTGLFLFVGYALAGENGMLVALAFAALSNLFYSRRSTVMGDVPRQLFLPVHDN